MESVEEKFLDDHLLPSLDLAPRAWLQAFALVRLRAQVDNSDSSLAELQADALRYQASVDSFHAMYCRSSVSEMHS